MLSNEVMGVLALSIVWVNTFLIAAHAWKTRASLGRLLDELEAARGRGELVRARILRGNGAGGAFAERRVIQVGRAMTTPGPDRILFTDRRSEMRIAGGEVEIDGGAVSVEQGDGRVWTGRDGQRDAVGFDAAWSRAATNKGFESGLVIPVTSGEVWLRGKREGARMLADLVATSCPTTLLARARRTLLAFTIGSVIAVGAITAVCLVQPAFGTVSMIGAALMVAFFLIIQPAGVRMRDATRTPDEQPIGGVWQRPTT